MWLVVGPYLLITSGIEEVAAAAAKGGTVKMTVHIHDKITALFVRSSSLNVVSICCCKNVIFCHPRRVPAKRSGSNKKDTRTYVRTNTETNVYYSNERVRSGSWHFLTIVRYEAKISAFNGSRIASRTVVVCNPQKRGEFPHSFLANSFTGRDTYVPVLNLFCRYTVRTYVYVCRARFSGTSQGSFSQPFQELLKLSLSF